MTKHLRLIGITLSILGMQLCFSQENFLPGYIVTLKGDSTHGFIDYRNWNKNPDRIFFKPTLEEEKSVYTPIDIKLFRVKYEIYESAIVEAEESTIDFSALEYDPNLQIRIDTIFLQTMIKGETSLYHYNDKNNKDHFYIKHNGKFDLLVYKKYLTQFEGKSIVLENKKYIGQLTVYLKNCPSILAKISTTSYLKNSLKKLFLNYYECTKLEIEFQKKTEKILCEFGILSGISLSTLKFKYHPEPAFNKADYNFSSNFTFGLFLELILPRTQRKWSICNELIYTSFKVEGQYGIVTNQDWSSSFYTEFEYSYIKMNNMIRYKYPIGKFSVFSNIGFSNGWVIKGKDYKVVETMINSEINVISGKCGQYPSNFEVGYIIGLGTQFRAFSLETRYEKSTGIGGGKKSSTRRYYFLLGYRF